MNDFQLRRLRYRILYVPQFNYHAYLRSPPFAAWTLRESRKELVKYKKYKEELIKHIHMAEEFRLRESYNFNLRERWTDNLERAEFILGKIRRRIDSIKNHINEMVENGVRRPQDLPPDHLQDLPRFGRLHYAIRNLPRQDLVQRQAVRMVWDQPRQFSPEREFRQREDIPTVRVRLQSPQREEQRPVFVVDLPENVVHQISFDDMNLVISNDIDAVLLNIVHQGNPSCSVCMVTIQNLQVNNKILETNCNGFNHVICFACLSSWIKSCYNEDVEATCPTCRNTLLKF